MNHSNFNLKIEMNSEGKEDSRHSNTIQQLIIYFIWAYK